MTSGQMQWWNDNARFSVFLHLEIETFYMFAKILLDKIAIGFGHYFGDARGFSLISHDKLRKKIKRYAEIKKLTPPPPDLISLTDTLQKEVVGYRDKEINHERETRSVFGTAFSLGKPGSSRRMRNVINPTKDELEDIERFQKESKPLSEVTSDLNRYLDLMIQYIAANRQRTVLPLKFTPPPPLDK